MPLEPAALAGRRVVTLPGETDFDAFRRAARRLLALGLAPEAVDWAVADDATPTLFAAQAAEPDATSGLAVAPATLAATPAAPELRVAADFIAMCRDVVLHRDRRRFPLLYRLLWRLQHDSALRHDPLDADMALARTMQREVTRDQHKMKAFVRFRPLAGAEGEPTMHVAWFEPGHHIVGSMAPFFVRRFAALRWAVLTPERCLRWDGAQLHLGPGADRRDAPPADAGEALWLTYYRSIFNPARLKLRAMTKEMPRRYWPNLPEAALIGGLAAAATERHGRMLEHTAELPVRLRRVAPSQSASAAIDAPTPRAAGSDASAPAACATATSAAPAWQQLRAAATACRACPLGALATQTVWGEGPPDARLMLVGEQPGDQEDLQGRPFVGPAGQLLARAMAQLGWQRGEVYLTNAVKHFKYLPRGKRRMHKTPAQREADACLHWLEAEIATLAPAAIVALGATAARQLLGRPVAVMRERGEWLKRNDGVPVLITLHPAALLRTDALEQEAAYLAWLADMRRASPHVRSAGVGHPASLSYTGTAAQDLNPAREAH